MRRVGLEGEQAMVEAWRFLEFEVLSGRHGAEQKLLKYFERGGGRGCPVSGHSEEGAERKVAWLEATRGRGKWLNPSSGGLTGGCGVWEGGKGCPGWILGYSFEGWEDSV